MTCEQVAPTTAKSVKVTPGIYNNPREFRGTWVFSHPIVPMPSYPFISLVKDLMVTGRREVVFDLVDSFPTLSNRVNLTLEHVKEDTNFRRKVDYTDGSLTLDPSISNLLVAAREIIDAHCSGLYYSQIRKGTTVDLKIKTSSRAIYSMSKELNRYLDILMLAGGKLDCSNAHKIMDIIYKNHKRLQKGI